MGIVGAGISGLYSALLLQHHIPNVRVKVFEASDRVGGRIYTHKFSDDPYQYCEAGAMRIPCIPYHNPVFSIINYVNKLVPGKPLELIDFVYSFPSGIDVYVNRTKMKNGIIMNMEYASTHCSELGFSPSAEKKDGDDAWKLMKEALEPVLLDLKSDFEKGMDKYGNMSLHHYLTSHAGWSEERITYYEVTCGITNESHSGLLDLLPFLYIFGGGWDYKTIEGGMSLLPEQCAQLVSNQGGEIMLHSKILSLSETEASESIKLTYEQQLSKTIYCENFDAVIISNTSSMYSKTRETNLVEHSGMCTP